MELFRGEGRRTWQLRFTDNRGFRRQLSTRTRDRGTALAVSQKIERLVDVRIRGDQVPADLQQWVSHCHKEVREQLVAWAIVDAGAAAAGELLYNTPPPDPLPPGWKDPPPALVDLWQAALEEGEITPEHAKQSAQRVRALFQLPVADLPPLRYAADICQDSVMPRVRELRRVGAPHGHKKRKRKPFIPRTCQYYLDRAKEFCGWLVSKGILTVNPLAGCTAYSDAVMRSTKQRDRRALSIEQQRMLISVVPSLPDRHRMTGAERARIYHLALRSGLRAKEIRTLTVAQVNLFTKQLTILAGRSKARREDLVPIVEDLVEPLRQQTAGKHPSVHVFTRLNHKKYCEMLREDLESLGIPFIDALGKYADFHALRHTYGTELAKVAMPTDHMKLMRHKDIRTTMEYYVHVEEQSKAAAIAKLPALEAPQQPANGQRAG